MENKSKKFLVTFIPDVVNNEDANNILGISGRDAVDGVSLLSGDEIPQYKDVLNFEKMGIASLQLTDKEIKKLKRNNNVLAVEEDTEMHIMEIENNFYEKFLDRNENYDILSKIIKNTESSYQKGISDAITFILSSITYGREKSLGTNSSSIQKLGFTAETKLNQISELQQIPWNISIINAPSAWSRGVTGNGVNVAVLDTGIAPHPDLIISGGVSFVPGVLSYNDDNSHGTHCAGIIGAKNRTLGIAGVAPNCNLYAVKVLNKLGKGLSSEIIAGMEWCLSNGIQVISMSLGGKNPPSIAYAQAIKKCQDAGITVVVASGNSFSDPTPPPFPWVCSPANSILSEIPNASPIAVGSITQDYSISYFSSRGGQVQLWNHVSVVAPGSNINSTVPGGGYSIKSGTSMACPHVSGTVALIKQIFPQFTPAEVKERLSSTAKNLNSNKVDLTFGAGLINCDLAT